eukprot:5623191-Prymnesium_polylepis.1
MQEEEAATSVIRHTTEHPLVRSYTWANDGSVFTGPVTGTHPVVKNWSYYKRSWVQGRPFGTLAIWDDIDHTPSDRQYPNIRPDLALGAMKGILKRYEAEIVIHEQQCKDRQVSRQEHLRRFREKHLVRHQKMEKLGAPSGGRYQKVLHEEIGASASDGRPKSRAKPPPRKPPPSAWTPPQLTLVGPDGATRPSAARHGREYDYGTGESEPQSADAAAQGGGRSGSAPIRKPK